ncbi:hypothetical protein BaRGS_00010951, partial [Batillaria attramentaria]
MSSVLRCSGDTSFAKPVSAEREISRTICVHTFLSHSRFRCRLTRNLLDGAEQN